MSTLTPLDREEIKKLLSAIDHGVPSPADGWFTLSELLDVAQKENPSTTRDALYSRLRLGVGKTVEKTKVGSRVYFRRIGTEQV